MHIRLLTGPLDGAAGSCIYNHELALRLQGRGHEVEAICLPFVSGASVPYAHHALDCAAPVPVLWRLDSLRNESILLRQMKALRPARPDITIGCEHWLLRGHARLFPDAPWIYFPHALDIPSAFGPYAALSLGEKVTRWHRTRIQSWALRSATRVMRFTRMGVEKICQCYGIHQDKRDKFIVNPPGVRSDSVGPQGTVESRGLRMILVGSLLPVKRVDDALSALATIDNAADWRLDIVGDGPERVALERLRDQLGLGERVRFTGQVQDMTSVYRDADLLLFPSRAEGFGLVITEAMSNGIPVLAYSNEAPDTSVVTDELITHGQTGFLVHSFDDFRTHLVEAIARPRCIRELAQQTRQHALATFNWDRHVDLYERTFKEISH